MIEVKLLDKVMHGFGRHDLVWDVAMGLTMSQAQLEGLALLLSVHGFDEEANEIRKALLVEVIVG